MGFIVSLIIFFLAVIFHEFAHGLVAYKLGDPTAKYSGRLTLNPIAHIDPIGTIVLPLFLIITGSPFLFGWAKPVPVNFSNLRNPKKGIIWVGIAGPCMNIIIAVLMSLIAKLRIPFLPLVILEDFIILNLVLAVFNLIPIPPLDGSRVVMGLLPTPLSYRYMKLEPYGFIIIMVMLYLGLFQSIIWPIVLSILKFLI